MAPETKAKESGKNCPHCDGKIMTIFDVVTLDVAEEERITRFSHYNCGSCGTVFVPTEKNNLDSDPKYW
ncbi:MAG: hypothetical protein OEX08_03095 [Candidatus Nomurabacteria bacterium]|nr:hypothetical protein [Candidatus Nomurabacteria bacterium]